MPHYIYRIVSAETASSSKNSEASANFELDYPFNWNVASPNSWRYAEKKEAENSEKGHMEKHMKRVRWHFGTRDFRIENFDIDGLIPEKPGVNDPLEGFIIDPKTIRVNSEKIVAKVVKKLSRKWRSICFSTAECEQSNIEKYIEDKIIETEGYGYKHCHYLYGELTQDLFMALIQSCTKVSPRIGATGVKVHYFSQENISPGGIIFPASLGLPGCSLLASCLNKESSIVKIGQFNLSYSDVNEFEKDIKPSIPFKYGPAYSSEQEIRFCFYSFEGWQSERVPIALDNSNLYFKFRKSDVFD